MNLLKSLENRIRGWLPNNPILFATNRAKYSRKLGKWVADPFSTLGTLMIVASLLSAVFGTGLISAYLAIPFGSVNHIFYSGLYIGILSLAAFALGSYSGILLFAEKHFNRAVTGMALILCFELATLLITILEGLPSQSGLLVASPMIASSVTSLLIAALNMVSQRTKRTIPKEKPAIREIIFAVFGVAGIGLTAIGIAFHFTPLYPRPTEAVLAIGVPLLAVAFLIRRTYKHTNTKSDRRR